MMEHFPHEREDALARLTKEIKCLRKMYARGDPMTSAFFRNAVSVDEGTAEPSREGETINDPTEEVTTKKEVADDEASLPSASNQSHRREMSGGEGSISIDQPPAFSASRKTVRNRELRACDVSEKNFSVACRLKIHKRTHKSEKPFPCDFCEKRFARPDVLKVHRRIHAGEKLSPCDVCGKRFTTSGNLKTHRRVHTDEKPFACDVCKKKFKQVGHLICHQRIHTGERPQSPKMRRMLS